MHEQMDCGSLANFQTKGEGFGRTGIQGKVMVVLGAPEANIVDIEDNEDSDIGDEDIVMDKYWKMGDTEEYTSVRVAMMEAR